MHKGRSLGQKISTGAILASISAVAVFILLAVVSGIIGGRADAIFVWLWDLLARSITANSWPWILTSGLFLTLVAFSGLWWFKSRSLNYQLDTISQEIETKNAQLSTLSNEVGTKGKELAAWEKMLELDESLLRLIASVMSEEDLEKAMKNLVFKFLMSATSAFPGDVHRASLLLPDAKKEYLKIWEGYQMPDESKLRTHFYIGTKEMDKMRGIAGEAFFYRQLRVIFCQPTAILNYSERSTALWTCYHPRRNHPKGYRMLSAKAFCGMQLGDTYAVKLALRNFRRLRIAIPGISEDPSFMRPKL